jgi:FKBP-type peptidyl-prolyl cis-trans isomerase FklB
MLRITFLITFILPTSICFSQATKPVKSNSQAVQVKAAGPNPLKNLCDSASYTAGIYAVNKYKAQNVYEFNPAIVAKAVNDLQTNKSQLITDSVASLSISAYRDLLAKNPKPVFKTTGSKLLKNLRDSASYAAGLQLVKDFRDFDITNLNSAVVSKAVSDLQQKKQPVLRDSIANLAAVKYRSKLQEEKNNATIEAGKKFLDENKKRPSVKVTNSGLQYEILTQGTGPIPTVKDKISCHYAGSFIDGTEFENSYKTGQPVSFYVTQVIQGWTEALQLMPVGSKWKLYIPYDLAYGPGQYHSIPGGSTLIFEIELLGIAGK